MSEKFKKDLELCSKVIYDAMDSENDKDDRIFCNLYLIEKQLGTIKVVLIITAILLFFSLFK